MMLSISPHNKSRNFLIPLVAAFCFFIASYCFAADVKLSWDANTEPDLAGYKIYYDVDSGALYEGTEANEGESPIQVLLNELNDSQNPEFTLTNLDVNKKYFFVVTAHDTEGLESDYSNEVFTTDMQKPSAPVITFTVKITVETQGQ